MSSTSKVFVFVGPSGSGKSSLSNRILELRPHFVKCRTATTRKPRGRGKKREVHGIHYDFLPRKVFATMRRCGKFMETKQVHGKHWYGIPKANLLEHLCLSKTVILCIDMQGFLELKSWPRETLYFAEIYGIFITVPDPWKETLQKRLRGRVGGVSEEDLIARLQTAELEMHRQSACDHVIINDDLESAVKDALEFMNRHSVRD